MICCVNSSCKTLVPRSIPLALVRFARRQMARAGLTMLDLAGGRRAETFLDAFVGLLLGHGYLLRSSAVLGRGALVAQNPHTTPSLVILLARDSAWEMRPLGGKLNPPL